MEDAAALDFILSENKVCWTELNYHAISCSEINPSKKGRVDKETIVESGVVNPEGIACDWMNHNIYWTDSETKRIEVVSLKKPRENEIRDRKVIVWKDLDMPRAIALSPHDG